MTQPPPTPADILNLIATSTQAFELTEPMVEIGEWDRQSPINGVPAAEVIASLADPSGRLIPETRPCILQVPHLGVVLVVQRCVFETNAPIYSDADVQRVTRWMRETLLPGLLASPGRVRKGLQTALTVRLFAELSEPRIEQG